MARKQNPNPSAEEHAHITIEITNFNVSIDVGRNYLLNDLKRCDRNTKLFKHDSYLEIVGNCIYPDSLKGQTHAMTIFSKPMYEDQYEATLNDCQAMDG